MMARQYSDKQCPKTAVFLKDMEARCITMGDPTRVAACNDVFRRVGLDVSFFNAVAAERGKRYGCFESHWKVLHSLYHSEKNLPHALIFEDDTCWDVGWEQVVLDVERFVSEEKRPWDVLFFGSYHVLLQEQSSSCPQIWRAKTLCAHAYVISRQGMKAFLDTYPSPVDEHYDDAWMRSSGRTYTHLSLSIAQRDDLGTTVYDDFVGEGVDPRIARLFDSNRMACWHANNWVHAFARWIPRLLRPDTAANQVLCVLNDDACSLNAPRSPIGGNVSPTVAWWVMRLELGAWYVFGWRDRLGHERVRHPPVPCIAHGTGWLLGWLAFSYTTEYAFGLNQTIEVGSILFYAMAAWVSRKASTIVGLQFITAWHSCRLFNLPLAPIKIQVGGSGGVWLDWDWRYVLANTAGALALGTALIKDRKLGLDWQAHFAGFVLGVAGYGYAMAPHDGVYQLGLPSVVEVPCIVLFMLASFISTEKASIVGLQLVAGWHVASSCEWNVVKNHPEWLSFSFALILFMILRPELVRCHTTIMNACSHLVSGTMVTAAVLGFSEDNDPRHRSSDHAPWGFVLLMSGLLYEGISSIDDLVLAYPRGKSSLELFLRATHHSASWIGMVFFMVWGFEGHVSLFYMNGLWMLFGSCMIAFNHWQRTHMLSPTATALSATVTLIAQCVVRVGGFLPWVEANYQLTAGKNGPHYTPQILAAGHSTMGFFTVWLLWAQVTLTVQAIRVNM